MPELPEVETTRRGIAPHVEGRRIVGLVVREPRLRWPVPPGLGARLRGRTVDAIGRRGKYLLLQTDAGTALLHLGMSGSLRVLPAGTAPGPHDHIDFVLDGDLLRLRDPRRFGALLWGGRHPQRHPLLKDLGPEPLGDGFDGDHLYRRSRGRRVAVKDFIMNSRIVVGVGNIYAAEALYASGIHPARAAGRIGQYRYNDLADAIRSVLASAIDAGGTTLRDFIREDGRPGYFRNELKVYGREHLPCPTCGTPLRGMRLGQRSTVYCPRCQR